MEKRNGVEYGGLAIQSYLRGGVSDVNYALHVLKEKLVATSNIRNVCGETSGQQLAAQIGEPITTYIVLSVTARN